MTTTGAAGAAGGATRVAAALAAGPAVAPGAVPARTAAAVAVADLPGLPFVLAGVPVAAAACGAQPAFAAQPAPLAAPPALAFRRPARGRHPVRRSHAPKFPHAAGRARAGPRRRVRLRTASQPGQHARAPYRAPYRAAVLVVTMPGVEDPVDGALQLAAQERPHQPLVDEHGVGQGEPDPADGVVAEPAHLGAVRAGHGDRVPRAGRLVRVQVLHRVQQMRQPTEQAAGLRQRFGVARAVGEHRGVGEGGCGRRLRGLGDRQQRATGAGRPFDVRLPLDRPEQQRGVEAEPFAARGAHAVPGVGDPEGRERHRTAPHQAVAVGHMVTHLRRGQHQRHRRRQPCALTLRHVRRPHSAQRARTGTPPPLPGTLRLRFGEHRDDQAVVVGGHPRELSVLAAQGQAQPAQVGHPLGTQALAQAVTARPDDSEHRRSPPLEQLPGRNRPDGSREQDCA